MVNNHVFYIFIYIISKNVNQKYTRAQSCPPLCGPMNCSLPGSSVHGIFQARILEWVAISSSRQSSWPRIWTHAFCVSYICVSITWEAPKWRCVKPQTVFQISTDPFVSVSQVVSQSSSVYHLSMFENISEKCDQTLIWNSDIFFLKRFPPWCNLLNPS